MSEIIFISTENGQSLGIMLIMLEIERHKYINVTLYKQYCSFYACSKNEGVMPRGVNVEAIERIGSLRVEIRRSAVHMARVSGISRGTIAKIESGRPAEAKTVVSYLKALEGEAREIGAERARQELQNMIRRIEEKRSKKNSPQNPKSDARALSTTENMRLDFILRKIESYVEENKLKELNYGDVVQMRRRLTGCLGAIRAFTGAR